MNKKDLKQIKGRDRTLRAQSDVRKELGQLKADFQIMKDKLEEALHVQF